MKTYTLGEEKRWLSALSTAASTTCMNGPAIGTRAITAHDSRVITCLKVLEICAKIDTTISKAVITLRPQPALLQVSVCKITFNPIPLSSHTKQK